MGARPLWSLVSIGLPEDVWNDSFKDEFFEGYLTLADEYGVALAGGEIHERVLVAPQLGFDLLQGRHAFMLA